MARWDRGTIVTIVIAITSLILSGFVGYSFETDDTHQRIRAVEVQQENDTRRLERIENKVDQIYLYIVKP